MCSPHSAANFIAGADCMSTFVASGNSVDVVRKNISNIPTRNLKIKNLCWSTFHSVVCTVHVYQVTVCKMFQHCAHTYVYSYAKFWHVPLAATKPSSGKITPQTIRGMCDIISFMFKEMRNTAMCAWQDRQPSNFFFLLALQPIVGSYFAAL